MDRQTAVKIIRDTFERAFDRGQFFNFSKNLVNFLDTSKPFIYRGNMMPDAYERSIHSLERMGKYEDAEDNKIDVLIVRLKKEYSLERARTMQRNFVAWYLNGSRGGELKDAALVAFVSPDDRDWRFSLVRMDYNLVESPTGRVKVEKELTPARRFSFLVGESESSHTAQVQLLPILEHDERKPLLSDFEKAFSIEVVTREFFTRYRDLFHKVDEALQKSVQQDKRIREDFRAKGVDTINFAKKLLGQVVFIYFLQKKGWFGVDRDESWGRGPKDFLRRLFEKKIVPYGNFFNDVLEPLFYETLAVERTDDFSSHFNCKIPFLNGGLFEPINNYDWVHTDILLADGLFSNTERTKEGDIGTGILDVFDRYNFTVKEDEPLDKEVAVDPEMLGKVFENLLEVKDRKSKGTYYTPREIVHYMCQESLINYLDTTINTGEVPLVSIPPPQGKLFGKPDPEQAALRAASYHAIMPREDIEALVHTGELAIEHDIQVETYGKETEHYSYKLPESIRWNAKLIDDKLASIRVCDPAIGSGAFPVGLMTEIVRTRNTLTTYLPDKGDRTNYHFKRHAIQNCLYGVDIDPGAVEIAKLRLWLSLVVDEENIKQIQPLPNLDYKIVCGNSLLGVEKNLFNVDLFNTLESLKPIYFNETNVNKKQEYKKQIDKLIRQITNNNKTFDFEVYFSEIFHEKGGFDVVIANPPYGANIDSMVEIYRKYYYDVMKNYAEIYKIFFGAGIKVLNDGGVLTFITSNTFLTQPRYKDLRDYLLNYQICRILNLGEEVFEVGIVPVCITLIKNQKFDESYFFADVSLRSKFSGSLNRVDFITVAKDDVLTFDDHSLLVAHQLKEGEVYFKEVLEIKDAGIQYHRSGIGLKKKGGIDLYDRLFSDSNKYYPKCIPVWYGSLINRYYISKDTNEYFNPDYKKILRANESVSFSREAFAIKEKILWRQTASELIATLDREGRWFRNTIQCCWLKENYRARIDIKYALAIINSEYINFIYNLIVKETGRVYPQVKITHVKKLPFKVVDRPLQQPFVDFVDQILTITKDDDYFSNPTKQARVKELERRIDQMVYELYGLTPEEIGVVKGR